MKNNIRIYDDDVIEIDPFVTRYVQANLDWNMDDVRYEIVRDSEDND